MKQPKFKVGEWCFFEFKLHQVAKTEQDRIITVTDGSVRTSGDATDRCYPLELDIKQLSDAVYYFDRKIMSNSINGLNFPDFHRKFTNLWVDMCENKDNADKLEKLYKELQEFGDAILKRIDELKKNPAGYYPTEKVCGVFLFRQ